MAGAQCSGETRAAMHQGAKKSACKKTPPVKCATLKTSDNASIPAFLSDSGVLVMSQGAPVIDRSASGDLKITLSADRVAFAIGAPFREGRLKCTDQQYRRQQRTVR